MLFSHSSCAEHKDIVKTEGLRVCMRNLIWACIMTYIRKFVLPSWREEKGDRMHIAIYKGG